MYDPIKIFMQEVNNEKSGMRYEIEKREYARSRSELRKFKDRCALARRKTAEKKAKKNERTRLKKIEFSV